MAVNTRNSIVTSGLVLYLDAGSKQSYVSGSTVWSDLSGNNNSGSLVNGPAFSSDGGGAIAFDGSNDTVSFQSTFNATTAGLVGYHSVEMWVYPYRTDQPNDGLIRSLNAGGEPFGRYLHYIIRSNKFYLGWYGVDTPGLRTISPNNWYHVVFMFDTDDRQKIYVNGTLDAQSAIISGNAYLTGGKFYNGATAGITLSLYGTYFQGLLPVTRIYNRALTPQEIQQNYNATKTRFGL